MKYAGKKVAIIVTAALFIMAALASILWAADTRDKDQKKAQEEEVAAQAVSKDAPDSRLNRIDFGNTYIIGQTIKSGAVYLLQRKKSEINSMLKYREDYRDEILEGFLPDDSSGAPKDQEGTRTAKRDRPDGVRLLTEE
jgi:flagellar basal body-associated protein FliL